MNYFTEIEKIIRQNLDKRGMDKINLLGEFEKAAKELFFSTKIIIITGFVIRDTLTGETDGPLGALSLAYALNKMGKEVIFVTDKYTNYMLEAGCELLNLKIVIETIEHDNARLFASELLNKHKPSHIVAIERPGRGKNDKCYSMRGEDLTDLVPNTDHIISIGKNKNICTIAIGDGGNEVGMGKVSSIVRDTVKNGNIISARLATDYLIVAGVSNWAGHGLSAALSILDNDIYLYNPKMELEILKRIVELGAVDGCSKKSTLTVDGLSLENNLLILKKLMNIVKKEVKNNKRIAM